MKLLAPRRLFGIWPVSPASNGGRGLKRQGIDVFSADDDVSPASNGGRGLKQFAVRGRVVRHKGLARQ